MIKVLSTGELSEDIQSYASQRGLSIDVVPFIRINNVLNAEKTERIRSLNTDKRTVIFTSKNAVHAVASIIDRVPEWEFYCIDGATRQNIKHYWKTNSIKGTSSNGKELARIILKDNVETTISNPLVFFCGSRRLNTIPNALTKAKVPYEEISVYETENTPTMVKKIYDAILFYSPSEVHSFFSKNKVEDTALFAIGKTTLNALSDHTTKNNTIILSQWADKARMIDLLINYFNQKQ